MTKDRDSDSAKLNPFDQPSPRPDEPTSGPEQPQRPRHLGSTVSEPMRDANRPDSREQDFDLHPGEGPTDDLFSAGLSDEIAAAPQPFLSERFEFGEVLGEGSFGVVYRAYDRALHRDVAIKAGRLIALDSVADLFYREARAASRLRHPNIVTVHDVIKNQDGVFIVSDLIRGHSLHRWLAKNQPTVEQAAHLVATLCDAMEYAHQHGVIHRDLKSGNIVMDQDDCPYVLDFGLSQSLDSGLETITHEGQPIGTPAFMAPEQVRGNRNEIDQRSDVYSLGVILFQALTQRLPFSGERVEIYQAILQDSPMRPRRWDPQIPGSLEAICLKAMAKDPGHRYQTAGEMAADLRRFLEGRPVRAYGQWDRRVLRSVLARRWMLATLVLTSVGLVVVAGSLLSERSRRFPSTFVVIQCDQGPVQVEWTPFDPETGLPQLDQVRRGVTGKGLALPPGFYHLQLNRDGERMEVFRTVPANRQRVLLQSELFHQQVVPLKHRSSYLGEGDMITLPEIKWVMSNQISKPMRFFSAASVSLPSSDRVMAYFKDQRRELLPFLLATEEVRWADLQRQWPDLQIPSHVSPQQACQGVSWDVAIAYAESQGCLLPNPWELHWAATNGGTSDLPAGISPQEIAADQVQPLYGTVADWDVTLGEPPLRGILTGVNEWTEMPLLPIRMDPDSKQWARLPVSVSMSNDQGSTSDRDGPSDPGFPSSWIAVARIDDGKEPRWTVPESLMRLPKDNSLNNLGFRLVRRQP